MPFQLFSKTSAAKKNPGSRRRFWFFLFSVSVSGGIFIYLFTIISPAEIINLIRKMTPGWILLFLLFSFSQSFFRTWRYHVLLKTSGYRPDTIALYLITLVRGFFSDLLPARLGTLIYIFLVQTRLGIPFGPAASSFAYSFLFDMISLAFLILFAVLQQGSSVFSPAVLIGSATLLGLAGIAILFMLPSLLGIMAAMSNSVPLVSQTYRQRLYTALKGAEKDMARTREQGVFWRIMALSLGVRCSKYLSLYVLLLALVQPLGFAMESFPLPKVFLGLCSAELAASLPISGIAGFGAYEGAWALVFQLLGYPERMAVLTGISHHLFTQVYGYALGAVSLLILLLPWFKKTSVREDPEGKHWDRWFWAKFLAASAGITGLAFLIYAGPSSLSPPGPSAQNTIQPSLSESKDLPRTLAGRVVYQRPDGIYVLELQANKSQRIMEYGTYPRWSPDGRQIAFLHENRVMLVEYGSDQPRELTRVRKARAISFQPDGRSLLFTDGKNLRQVNISNAEVTTILNNDEFLEVDSAANGQKIAATVKTLTGYKVRVFDLQTGTSRTVASGCSASLSPDGTRITVNGQDHENLYLYDWENLQVINVVKNSSAMKFDNQYWSNDPGYIVSTSENSTRDIFIHDIHTKTHYQATNSGDCDRADLFITNPALHAGSATGETGLKSAAASEN
ncbi:MAG: flippase-like domain-containing protein [Desulfobulbaceae bacterium]|nr:flippase-like domain-containing protein [Desulfobulbaceae bacterium]